MLCVWRCCSIVRAGNESTPVLHNQDKVGKGGQYTESYHIMNVIKQIIKHSHHYAVRDDDYVDILGTFVVWCLCICWPKSHLQQLLSDYESVHVYRIDGALCFPELFISEHCTMHFPFIYYRKSDQIKSNDGAFS